MLVKLLTDAADALGTIVPPSGVPSDPGKLDALISKGLTLFGTIAVVLAVAFIIYAGFLYVTSGGDTSQLEKSQRTLIWALVGIVVVVIAANLVLWVAGALGFNVPESIFGGSHTTRSGDSGGSGVSGGGTGAGGGGDLPR